MYAVHRNVFYIHNVFIIIKVLKYIDWDKHFQIYENIKISFTFIFLPSSLSGASVAGFDVVFIEVLTIVAGIADVDFAAVVLGSDVVVVGLGETDFVGPFSVGPGISVGSVVGVTVPGKDP